MITKEDITLNYLKRLKNQLNYYQKNQKCPPYGFLVDRKTGLDFLVAIEDDLEDLKARAGRMIVAYTYDNQPVTVDDIKNVFINNQNETL